MAVQMIRSVCVGVSVIVCGSGCLLCVCVVCVLCVLCVCVLCVCVECVVCVLMNSNYIRTSAFMSVHVAQ
jgi:hypothetical protein